MNSAVAHRRKKKVRAEEDKELGELLDVTVYTGSCPCLYTRVENPLSRGSQIEGIPPFTFIGL